MHLIFLFRIKNKTYNIIEDQVEITNDNTDILKPHTCTE